MEEQNETEKIETESKIEFEVEDITGEKIDEKIQESPMKKWIKQIDVKKTILLENYHRKEYFHLVAEIILDDEKHSSGKHLGKKKRNTLIQFIPKISKQEFERKSEWLYLFVMNGHIVKIGGTRTGLKGRIASYLCGHHVEERGKSGDCSKTNGFIYNTFEFYLHLNCKIEMYAYELPKMQVPIQIFGKETHVPAQTYHAYESAFIEDYNQRYSHYPILCDNCDPDMKELIHMFSSM
jgi:hypothetical protein